MAGPLAPLLVGLREEGRGPGHEEPHAGHRLGRQPRLRQQSRVEGRDAHHGGRPSQRGQHLRRVEGGQEDHRAAREQHHVRRHEQAVGVEDGQRVHEHIVGGEAPALDQRPRVGAQVVVREHGAFRPPGGAGGVEDGRQVAAVTSHVDALGRRGAGGLQKRALALAAHRLQSRHAGRGDDGGHVVAPLRAADEHDRLGIAEEVVDLRRRVRGIERQVDGARPQAAEVEHDRGPRLLDLDGDPVARTDPGRLEDVGEAGRQRERVAVGGDCAVGQLGQDRRRVGRGRLDRREQVPGGHHPRTDSRSTSTSGTATTLARRYSPRLLAWPSMRLLPATPSSSSPTIRKLSAHRLGSS